MQFDVFASLHDHPETSMLKWFVIGGAVVVLIMATALAVIQYVIWKNID